VATLLRKIKLARWLEATWKPDDPLPADPLVDLATEGNSLSVWRVLPDRSNLPDVVAAIAARASNISTVHVVMVEEAVITGLGVVIHSTPGLTPLADSAPSHRHLVDLRAQTVVDIGEACRTRGEFQHFTPREIRQFLADRVLAARLNFSELQEGIQKDLLKNGRIQPPPEAH
jgi:hypothetical protein